MKIVHLSNNDIRGGAATAAYRINKALNGLDVDSNMVVQNKSSDSQDVEEVTDTKFQKGLAKLRPIYDKLPLKLYRNRQNGPFSVGKAGVNIAKNDLVKQSDVINLHWIVGGFLSIKSLKGLAKLDKPVVWTLHDQWAFTGGCHYSGECKKYEESCGECPFLRSNRKNDITRKIWKKKKKVYQNMNLTVVTPSKWLANCAKESSLFRDTKVKVIPNTLKTEIYKPVDQEIARDILNIPKDKKLVLFGAVSATSDERKGFRFLVDSLEILKEDEQIPGQELELLVFGASHSEEIENFPFKTSFLGYLHDSYSLALCYSAADTFVTPSLQDNLPNTIMESLSCGTPVVGFDVGGIPDMVEDKKNGYLAEYRSTEDLAEGITWVISDSERLKALGQEARAKVTENYNMKTISEKYRQLYLGLLE